MAEKNLDETADAEYVYIVRQYQYSSNGVVAFYTKRDADAFAELMYPGDDENHVFMVPLMEFVRRF